VTVARILQDVVGTNHAFTLEGWGKHLGIARHREFRERLVRDAGQRVQSVAFSLLVNYVVEERTDGRACELRRSIGDELHSTLEIELGCDGKAYLVQYFQDARLFLQQAGSL
jgi:hypothetical protein